MKYLKKVNKNFLKKFGIVIAFLMIGGAVTVLTVNLFLFYHKNVAKVPLYYEFKPHTISYESENIYTGEKYLSYDISYGIDVSEWQGAIDWEKVRSTGIAFAMIRCGFRESNGSNIKEDARFKENIEGALRAGLRVGVYFYGTATTKEEALEEANFTLSLVKPYDLFYPIAYDIESFDTGRLKNVSYSLITDNILTYTETIASYGYDTMVYSFKNAFTYKLDTGKLDGKNIWLAHYVGESDYRGNYAMWQYTNEGKVSGVPGYVDLNISYFTYVDDPKKVVANPNEKEVTTENITPIDDEIVVKAKATLLGTPTKDLPNRIGYIERGVHLKRTGISENFSQILYENKTAYIENTKIELSS